MLSSKHALDAARQSVEHLLVPAPSQTDSVRCADHARVGVETMPRARRFGREHVERHGREPACQESVSKGVFTFDYVASGSVDENGSGLDPREEPPVNQSTGSVVERAVECDHVRTRQEPPSFSRARPSTSTVARARD